MTASISTTIVNTGISFRFSLPRSHFCLMHVLHTHHLDTITRLTAMISLYIIEMNIAHIIFCLYINYVLHTIYTIYIVLYTTAHFVKLCICREIDYWRRYLMDWIIKDWKLDRATIMKSAQVVPGFNWRRGKTLRRTTN